MADRTESSVVTSAPAHVVMAVVGDFERYPEWVSAVTQATVLDRFGDGRGRRVRFTLDAGPIRDTYTLDYTWVTEADGTGSLSWQLVESTVFTALDGTYEVRADPAGSRIRYLLAVSLRIPMLGMLRRKAELAIVDAALTELVRRVEA